MNAGFYWCIAPASIFFLFAFIFHLGKEKSTLLINGFNCLPKEEREKYDRRALALDYRNNFLIWASVMILGACLSWIFSSKLAFLAYTIWAVLFIKDLHFDVNRAFNKYRLKP